MKPFHDAYCLNSSIVFAIGETGLGYSAPIATRLAWLADATSEATVQAMPKLVGVS